MIDDESFKGANDTWLLIRGIYIFQNLKVNFDWKSISHYCMSFSFGFLFSISLGIRVWDFFENIKFNFGLFISFHDMNQKSVIILKN